MKSVDILCGDPLYAEMLKYELKARGYRANIGRSSAPDLIIADLDGNFAVKGPFVLTFSREYGADLRRPFDIKELLEKIKEKLAEETALPEEEKGKSGLYVSPYERHAVYNDEIIVLSELEHRLLLYLYNNKDADVNELSREVFGEDSNPNLVRVYINYLRKKIDNRFRIKLILTKRGKGYFLAKETQK